MLLGVIVSVVAMVGYAEVEAQEDIPAWTIRQGASKFKGESVEVVYAESPSDQVKVRDPVTEERYPLRDWGFLSFSCHEGQSWNKDASNLIPENPIDADDFMSVSFKLSVTDGDGDYYPSGWDEGTIWSTGAIKVLWLSLSKLQYTTFPDTLQIKTFRAHEDAQTSNGYSFRTNSAAILHPGPAEMRSLIEEFGFILVDLKRGRRFKVDLRDGGEAIRRAIEKCEN